MKLFILLLWSVGMMTLLSAQEIKKLKKNTLMISIERESCRGFCPSYKMVIYGDGSVEYEGKRNVDNIGMYEKKIGKDKVKELLKAFQDANYLGLDNEYDDPAVADVPATLTSIKFLDKESKADKSKNIRNRSKGPEALNKLQDQIDAIVGKDGFKKKS